MLHQTKVVIFALVSVLALPTGCGTVKSIQRAAVSPNDPSIQAESSRVINRNHGAVWAATMKTLTLYGVDIKIVEKESGMISTDWVIINRPFFPFKAGLRTRSVLLIEKVSANSAKITETSMYEQQVNDNTPWRKIARPKEYVDAETKFFNDIESNL